MKIIELKASVTVSNDRDADALRQEMREKGVLLVNLMGSPGAGKTLVLLRLIEALKPLRVGVMEADVDSDVDARTVVQTGARVIQLHTAGLCHMDADMTRRGLERMGVEGLDVVFLENIGNLVCPAEFEVGADLRVAILSVPEGDDKPLKYPLMFKTIDCLIVNKLDTLPIFDFDLDRLRGHMARLRPEAPVFPVSARTGEGMAALAGWLKDRLGGEQA